jgi:hypothetical protein
MGRKKIISVKHYLNKGVKPQIWREQESYPVYIRLRYDNKQTQLKSNFARFIMKDELRYYYEEHPRIFSASEFLIITNESIKIDQKEDLYGFLGLREAFQLEVNCYNKIINFFLTLGHNILETNNPSGIISHLSFRLFEALSENLKGELDRKIFANPDYKGIWEIIDLEESFDKIFSELWKMSSSDFKQHILNDYHQEYQDLQRFKNSDLYMMTLIDIPMSKEKLRKLLLTDLNNQYVEWIWNYNFNEVKRLIY